MATGGGNSPPASKGLPGLHLHPEKEHDQSQPDAPVDEVNHDSIPATSAQPRDAKENEKAAVTENKGAPLTLLNLPVDVLRLIVNEVNIYYDSMVGGLFLLIVMGTSRSRKGVT
jgi:hypothetical protein